MQHCVTLGVLVVLSLALAAVHASDVCGQATNEAAKNKDCSKGPPSGSWLVAHIGKDFTTLSPAVAGRSVLSLQEDFPTAYSGNGSGVYNMTLGGSFIDGYSYVYQILGIFNPATCILSGSLYRLQGDPLITDSFKWTYDGEKLKGFSYVWLSLNPSQPRAPFFIPEEYELSILPTIKFDD